MNLNKVCFVFFVFILNTIIFSQTILRHNELMFSNNGGFRDVMHEESIYPLIPDDVNYLDSIIWLTATASLTAAQGYGTMNLVVRPPEIGSDRVFKKHLWAGPWRGGSIVDSKLYARISHYEGSASFDNTINTNLETYENFVSSISSGDDSKDPIDEDGNTLPNFDGYTPFISEFRIGTSLYENLMYINVEEGTLSGGKTGLSIETYEAIDITLERVNPVKLGLQMEGGDIFAGNLFVDQTNKKVFFSNGKNLSPTLMKAKMKGIYPHYDLNKNTALIVEGNVVAEQLFGKVVTLDSFTLKPGIGKICHRTTDLKTYTIHSSQVPEKKCSDYDLSSQFGILSDRRDVFTSIDDVNVKKNLSSRLSMSSQLTSYQQNFPDSSFRHSDHTSSDDILSTQLSGFFPMNWLLSMNTLGINLTASRFFDSTIETVGPYTLPDNADRVLVNVQSTVGAFEDSGVGFNHTLCTKVYWHTDKSPFVITQLYDALIDGNKLNNNNGTSSAMCKDYSTYDSEFTFFHTFVISKTELPSDESITFESITFVLYIYPIYEDGLDEYDKNIDPAYLEISNTSLIIQSFPTDDTNNFDNIRPSDNFDLDIKTYKEFNRHTHL